MSLLVTLFNAKDLHLCLVENICFSRVILYTDAKAKELK